MPGTTRSRFASVGGVNIHYLDYGGSGPVLLFVHGGRDHAHTWDFIAPTFTGCCRVFAVDLRGHGDSDWVRGALYTSLEHVADLAGLAAAIGTGPVCLVGHSFGSTVCLRWAGLQPARVHMVAALEGFGPPPTHPSQLLPRTDYLREWLDARIRSDQHVGDRTYATVRDAADRIREVNPRLSREVAQYLAARGTRRRANGRLAWKFDPVVRSWPPYGLDRQEAIDIYSGVRCPVLILRGLMSWTDDPEENPLVRALTRRHVIGVEDAGHWIHHDQPDRVIMVLRDWLSRHGVAGAASSVSRAPH